MLYALIVNLYNTSLKSKRNLNATSPWHKFEKELFFFLYSAFLSDFFLSQKSRNWWSMVFRGAGSHDHLMTACAAAFRFGFRLPLSYTEQCSQSHLIKTSLLCSFALCALGIHLSHRTFCLCPSATVIPDSTSVTATCTELHIC